MNDEFSITQDLLEAKKLAREFQQTSYSLKKIEERFPEVEFAPKEEMIRYIRTVLAFKFDIEESLNDLDKLYQKYKDGK